MLVLCLLSVCCCFQLCASFSEPCRVTIDVQMACPLCSRRQLILRCWWRETAADCLVRVVLDGDGPRPVSVSGTVASEKLRRVVNILFTCRFAEHLLSELLPLSHGRLRGFFRRLQGHFLLGGNLLGGLMPEHPKTMWCVVEDVFLGPPCQSSRFNTDSTGS